MSDDDDDTIKMAMRLDPDDFAALTAEIEYRSDQEVPPGTSDRLGKIVAEMCREMNDYREMFADGSATILKSDVRKAMLAMRARCPPDSYGEHAFFVIGTLMKELGLEAVDG